MEALRVHPFTAEEEQDYFLAAFDERDGVGNRNLYEVAKVMINQGCRPDEIMSSRMDPGCSPANATRATT